MKLSEMEYLKELAVNHPERFSDVENFKLLAKEHGINMDEAYQELEMDDAFVNTHEDPGLNPEVVQLHSHNYYEILYICSGNIQYLIRTERYRIQKGDIIIIPPGVGHQPIMPEGHKTPYKRYVLWLSTEFIKGIAPLFPDNDFLSRSCFVPPVLDGLRSIINFMLELWRKKENFQVGNLLFMEIPWNW